MQQLTARQRVKEGEAALNRPPSNMIQAQPTSSSDPMP